jgi:hypothetical protein
MVPDISSLASSGKDKKDRERKPDQATTSDEKEGIERLVRAQMRMASPSTLALSIKQAADKKGVTYNEKPFPVQLTELLPEEV